MTSIQTLSEFNILGRLWRFSTVTGDRDDSDTGPPKTFLGLFGNVLLCLGLFGSPALVVIILFFPATVAADYGIVNLKYPDVVLATCTALIFSFCVCSYIYMAKTRAGFVVREEPVIRSSPGDVYFSHYKARLPEYPKTFLGHSGYILLYSALIGSPVLVVIILFFPLFPAITAMDYGILNNTNIVFAAGSTLIIIFFICFYINMEITRASIVRVHALARDDILKRE